MRYVEPESFLIEFNSPIMFLKFMVECTQIIVDATHVGMRRIFYFKVIVERFMYILQSFFKIALCTKS